MTKQITYSPAYTLVPTYECFNRCTYCNFRVDPYQDNWLTLEKSQSILQKLQDQSVCEILILSGEVHPQSPRRKAWFQHIYNLCQLALSRGFLPHTNVGVLSFAEMETLKKVNASMGLMLEQITPKLLQTVHRHAPSKSPSLRLQQLEWAGQLKIPFTTGILLGIGEENRDAWQTLEAIAAIHQKWKHIQEVILQPHQLGSKQQLKASTFPLHQLPEMVAKARDILPHSITIQIPPNLITDPGCLLDCLEAGATDLGGISPKDEVNPDYDHFSHQQLVDLLTSRGWQLVPRLPVYPHYYNWLSSSVQNALTDWKKSSQFQPLLST
ncbi:7,8-didemethyl-8-hydroxy-5-deazariboflavin synthase subunit CofG [Crocosphaera sp.]|uniref:7,8-didemethyl-8-hydroxy-5-deazariboflavin synthase subunit CofG n=1 Tax=Crocosphaera sp. TaxID=2729996 RepID=UPI003F2231EE|nr:7,8-didemethyl-8-hydroxy-5-deazariboflavin synthase subunit CofG [Crocosphaera sp.]